MASEGLPAKGESQPEPVEIKFGDVIQFFTNGQLDEGRWVIVDPGTEEYTYASQILSDRDGEEDLAGGSTQSSPLKVVGSWPLEKVINGAVRHALDRDGQEIPSIRESYSKHYTAAAQKPPILYRGS